MKNQNEAVVEATEALVKLQDKYEANYDDLVKVLEYSLSNIKYPPQHAALAEPAAPPEPVKPPKPDKPAEAAAPAEATK